MKMAVVSYECVFILHDNFSNFSKTIEPMSRQGANNDKYLQYQKKIIDQIRKSATSPVLQGRFQCHKK